MSDKERQYATLENPTIAAIVMGSYSFVDRAKAMERLELTHQHFVTAKKTHKAPDGGPGMLMWIKGYDVTSEEANKGAMGNFAHVYCTKNAKGRHTLVAIKVERQVRYHPMRERPQHNHPDWGHPIMRAIKKGKKFASLEAAQDELNTLHEAFPDATIPNPGKLHVMVYERQTNKQAPMQKYILEIQLEKNGKYQIEAKKKEKRAPRKKAPAKTASKPTEETQGYFTQMVELKRTKKRKPSAIKKNTPHAKNTDSSDT